jgi:hypothetical protein
MAATRIACLIFRMARHWYLTGLDKREKEWDTRLSERPVVPSSRQARENIRWESSVGSVEWVQTCQCLLVLHGKSGDGRLNDVTFSASNGDLSLADTAKINFAANSQQLMDAHMLVPLHLVQNVDCTDFALVFGNVQQNVSWGSSQ